MRRRRRASRLDRVVLVTPTDDTENAHTRFPLELRPQALDRLGGVGEPLPVMDRASENDHVVGVHV